MTVGDTTRIEWTDATWSPVTGCTRVSPGCVNCYIDWAPPFRIEGRHFTDRDGNRSHEIGATTGVRLHPDRLDWPLRKRSWRGKRVFVCSMADLFHDEVPDDYIARVFAVMALTPEVAYQVLTKRPARMRSLLSSKTFEDDAMREVRYPTSPGPWPNVPDWPLPNVWLGVTVEDQERAYLRIPILLDTPAVVRWLSCEPLLGPVNLPVCRCLGVGSIAHGRNWPDTVCDQCGGSGSQIDWVVVGGESGPNARPMHPDWARSLRDQCASAGVPFLFKQWGEWVTESQAPDDITLPATSRLPFGNRHPAVWRVGKKRAGRLLDGIQHDGYPRGAS